MLNEAFSRLLFKILGAILTVLQKVPSEKKPDSATKQTTASSLFKGYITLALTRKVKNWTRATIAMSPAPAAAATAPRRCATLRIVPVSISVAPSFASFTRFFFPFFCPIKLSFFSRYSDKYIIVLALARENYL